MVLEHRYIVEKAINRVLKDYEVVHHIDENKSNNILNNLFLCDSDTQHKKIHSVDKQFLLMFNAARYEHQKDFKNFDILNSRQDQLQEMYEGDWWSAYLKFEEWMKENYNDVRGDVMILMSMEQLWLAFVMSERYSKQWNGTDWIKNGS